MFRHQFATSGNIIESCKIGACQPKISKIFLKVLNINLILNIF